MNQPKATIPHDKKRISTLIHAAWIVPVDGKSRLLADHSIAIHEGVILTILPSIEAKTKYSASKEYDLDSHVLMPGLINAHGHAPMSLFRGLADDMPLMTWLNDHIWPAEGKWVSEEFVHDGSELAIAEMLLGGTTTYSDMYFFPEVAADLAQHAGIRAQFVCPILDFPTIWGSGPEDYIEKSLRLAERYKESSRITIGFGPHAPYTVSDEPFKKIIQLADSKQLPIQIHLHETQQEVDDAIGVDQLRPIERLKQLGLINTTFPLQCVHMTALNDNDIATIAASGASVIHCPESNLKLASGFCPTEKLIQHGITVALGTDGAASNNDLDMLGEMRTAALIAKPIANDASALNAHTVIEMATLNGAKALGIDSTTGSLVTNKAADIIAIDLNHFNTQPSYDIVSDIVYSAASSQVTHVWVEGKLLVEQGKLCTLDPQKILSSAKRWADKIKQQS